MYHKKASFLFFFLLFPGLIFATGEKELTTNSFFALGTSCSAALYSDKEQDFRQIEEIVGSLEKKLSTNIAYSEITIVNNNAGIRPVAVSAETFKLVKKGIEFCKLSEGAFDITTGPLINLWNINEGGPEVPNDKKIKQALSLIGCKNIILSSESTLKTVFLSKENMVLEPGGIAKGFIADAVAKQIQDIGHKSALINFGGNVVAIGKKQDGTDWRIAIQNPEAGRGNYLGIISVKDKSVVTSGKYERFFIGKDGIRYHHIFDTKTGFPVENGIAQVTIISKNSTTADALSTSVFSMGIKKGLKLVKSLKNVDAIIVTEDKKIILTENIKINFKLTSQDFSIEEYSKN